MFYTLNSTGELVNGGSVLWTGEENANLVAWGAETGLDNGFQEGEEFTWMIWDNETGEILPAVATYDEIMPNEGYYANNGLSAINSLQALSSVTQTINLTQDGVFGRHTQPEITDISDVVSSIDSQIDIVKDFEMYTGLYLTLIQLGISQKDGDIR